MSLIMKDIIRLLSAKNIQLLAGKSGLSNQVSSVHIMFNNESLKLDTKDYLILIPFNLLGNHPETQKRLINHFCEAGSAGMGLKLELGEVLSEELKHLADFLNFPLFEIPFELALSEIMNEVNISIFDKQSFLIAKSNEIHKALTRLVLEGKSIEDIIKYSSNLIGCTILYFDIHFRPVTYCFMNLEQLTQSKVIHHIQKQLTQQSGFSISTQQSLDLQIEGSPFTLISQVLTAGKEYYGHIFLLDKGEFLSDIHYNALGHVCTVITLELIKQNAIQAAKQSKTKSLLEHLLFSNADDFSDFEELRKINLLPNKYIQCAIIDCLECDTKYNINAIRSNLCLHIQKILSQTLPLSLIAESVGGVIVVMVSRKADDFRPLILDIYDKLKAEYPFLSFHIGVGALVHSVGKIKDSYAATKTCLDLGKTIKGKNCLTFIEDIACYGILQGIPANSLLYYACADIEGALLNADSAGNTDLLNTIKTYLECDQSATETAKHLYIHRNTLANRLEKISDIVGPVWNDKETALNLRLYFRMRMLESARQQEQIK